MTRYIGKPCDKHPELGGIRLKSNGRCIACRNEKRHAQVRNKYHSDPEYREKYLARKADQKRRNYDYALHGQNYRARVSQRTPKWADMRKIEEIYRQRPEGFHVDHYYPLFGKTVSGLHVAENLRIIPQSENDSKGSKHPDEFYTFHKEI